MNENELPKARIKFPALVSRQTHFPDEKCIFSFFGTKWDRKDVVVEEDVIMNMKINYLMGSQCSCERRSNSRNKKALNTTNEREIANCVGQHRLHEFFTKLLSSNIVTFC
jgi:hypothetical protein